MRFEFIAGALCLDFANTIHDRRAEDKEEELHAISDVLLWAKEAGLLSVADHGRLATHYRRDPRASAAALAKAVTIRDLLVSIFAGLANGRSISSQRFFELNSALEEVPGFLSVRKDSDRIAMQWTSAHEGLQRVFFKVLTSAADLLASDRLMRLRECASNDCTWLFVDESRNRSRRWCDMSTCGNRMKARRHYRRGRSSQ